MKVLTYIITVRGVNHSRREFPDGTPVPFTPKGKDRPYSQSVKLRYARYGYNDLIKCTPEQAASPAMKHLGLRLWVGGATSKATSGAPAPAPAKVPADPTPAEETPTPAEETPTPAEETPKTGQDEAIKVPADWRAMDLSKIRALASKISGRKMSTIKKDEAIAIVSAYVSAKE